MDLINRLKFFMESRKVTISQFADTCGIPRPTLSQLMNGRNKRVSDEIINKIHNGFPSLSILWLMFGEGTMESAGNIEISEPQNGDFSTDLELQNGGSQEYNIQSGLIQERAENLSSGENGVGESGGMEYNLFREDIDGLNSDQAAFQPTHQSANHAKQSTNHTNQSANHANQSGQQDHLQGAHQIGSTPGNEEIEFDVHPNDITRTLFTSAGRQAIASDSRTPSPAPSSAPLSSQSSPHSGSAATGIRSTMNSGASGGAAGQQNRQPQQPARVAGSSSNTQDYPTPNASNPANNGIGAPQAAASSAQRIAMAQSGLNPAAGLRGGHNNDLRDSNVEGRNLNVDGRNSDARNVIAAAQDGSISISPDARKKITNIVVFYSDNSFQSFIPD